MKKIKNKYLIIILLGIIFLILLLIYFIINDNRKLTFIERGIKDSILLIEKTIYSPIRLLEQNDDNLSIDFLNSSLEEKDAKIKELEQLLNIQNNISNYEMINATIINRKVGTWYQTLTIDKGLNDGIENNMAVISNNGLIGKTIKITANTSTVKLLTTVNDDFQIAVKIKNNEDYIYGLLSGYEKGKLIITGVSENTAIIKDSKVITSGLDNNFPSDILVGTIYDVEKDNFDLSSKIYVTPANNFDHITYAAVLKRTIIE